MKAIMTKCVDYEFAFDTHTNQYKEKFLHIYCLLIK